MAKLAAVLTVAVLVLFLTIIILRALKVRNKIVFWTILLGVAGAIVGLKAPYWDFFLKSMFGGAILGLLIGTLLHTFQKKLP